jgi:hypothetical protein
MTLKVSPEPIDESALDIDDDDPDRLSRVSERVSLSYLLNFHPHHFEERFKVRLKT